MSETMVRSHWLGVWAAAAGICAVVTAEQLPIGLLTQIEAGLHTSAGSLGLLVTVPGVVAAAAAPIVPLAARGLDRRLLLTGLSIAMVLANVVSAMAPSFAVLMAARVVVGVSIGGFWAIAAGLATRLVPDGQVTRATAVIFGGVAAGNVLGTPVGTVLGGVIGWRPAFWALAGFAGLVGLGLVVGLPRLVPEASVRLAALRVQLRRPAIRVGLLLTVLVVAGHFVAFTFVSPILQDIAGFPASAVGVLLIGYGLAGLAGNAIAGRVLRGSVRTVLLAIAIALPLTLLAFVLFGTSMVTGTVMLVLWGLAYGGVSVTVQTWALRAAPDAVEPATALTVAVFNLSIAVGATAGGLVVDAAGPPAVLLGGAAVIALGALTLCWSKDPTHQESSRQESNQQDSNQPNSNRAARACARACADPS